MGFRFNRRIKLLPGVTINVSKSGLSTSLGPRGAKVTLGHGKTRTTVGLPGTGLSHSTVVSNNSASAAKVRASPLHSPSGEVKESGSSPLFVGFLKVLAYIFLVTLIFVLAVNFFS